MMTLSLILNVLVLVPVCWGLLQNASWARAVYGEATPARQILLAVYMAIGCASGLLLFAGKPIAVATLLALQVLYKVMTPLAVGTVRHPVVASNLAIAAVHSVTLLGLWRGGF